MLRVYLPWFGFLILLGFILNTDPPGPIVWLPTAIIGTLSIASARSEGAIEVYRKVNAWLRSRQEPGHGEG